MKQKKPDSKIGKPSNNPHGRNPIEVSPKPLEEQIENLAAMDATWREIEAVLGISRETINRRFEQAYEKGRMNGKLNIKRLAWQSAVAKSVPMQIFLLKNLVGYSDRVTQIDVKAMTDDELFAEAERIFEEARIERGKKSK